MHSLLCCCYYDLKIDSDGCQKFALEKLKILKNCRISVCGGFQSLKMLTCKVTTILGRKARFICKKGWHLRSSIIHTEKLKITENSKSSKNEISFFSIYLVQLTYRIDSGPENIPRGEICLLMSLEIFIVRTNITKNHPKFVNYKWDPLTDMADTKTNNILRKIALYSKSSISAHEQID